MKVLHTLPGSRRDRLGDFEHTWPLWFCFATVNERRLMFSIHSLVVSFPGEVTFVTKEVHKFCVSHLGSGGK